MAPSYISNQRTEKVALLIGFLSLTISALIAHRNPAKSYELSIYQATPVAFWIGVSIAIFIAAILAFRTIGSLRHLALILSGTCILTVVSLPIIRGYYFFGHGDALTHLGWAREISTGSMDPTELLYPGIHTISVIISTATGVPLNRALLLTVISFVLLYLLFLPLCTRALDSHKYSIVFGSLAACLLLPINGISLFVQPHPASQAVLFLPLVLFLAVRYLTGNEKSKIPFVKTPFGVLLALSSIAILLVHPQQTANVLIVYGSIVGVQWLYSLFRSDHVIAGQHRSLFGQTVFLGILFLIWMPTHQRASGSARYLVRQLLFRSNTAAKDITQQAGGLTQIGGSLESMFLKLFLISFIFCVITALTLLAGVSNRLSTPRVNRFSNYLFVAYIPLFALFGAYLITSTGKFHFRQLGFIMVITTIFGAIGLTHFTDYLSHRVKRTELVKSPLTIFFIVLLVLSGATLFHSPYVFQPSEHVTEGEVTGYETAFANRGNSSFIGLRAPGTRYADALYGVRERDPREFLGDSLYADTPATGKNFTGSYLVNYYNSSHYLPITATGRQREIRVYNGLRFPQRGFRSLESHPRIARVQSSDGFQLYYLRTSE
ncbi:hypothetical protein [Haladaptatus sp. DYF46]|uniref:hypothetical protein n=1 Tax=Haladaptatus sp. DYF46 TaxID=2886041 RepID=UPI001E51DC4B|nr:hypothetical protein [Haladaptatus sp. DYF46]